MLEMQDKFGNVVETWECVGSDWQDATLFVEASKENQAVMRLRINYNTEEESPTQVFVDQMTWTPGGGEPQQGDPVAPTTARVEGNVFLLTIPTSPATDYGVWTNADLSVPAADWGLWETKSGDGQPWTPAWTILPETPQLFFRAFKVK